MLETQDSAATESFRKQVFHGACDRWVRPSLDEGTQGDMWLPPRAFYYDSKKNQYTVNLPSSGGIKKRSFTSSTLGCLTNEFTVAELKVKVDALVKLAGKDCKGEGTFVTESRLVENWTLEHGNEHPTVQAASQFNAQEMTGPYSKPEWGVAIYMDDYTQGPAVVLSTPWDTLYRNHFFPHYNALQNWRVDLTCGGYFRPKSVLKEAPNAMWDSSEVLVPHVANAEFVGYRQWNEYVVLKKKKRFRYHQVLSSGIEIEECEGKTFDLVINAAYQGFIYWALLDYLEARRLTKTKRHKACLTLVGAGVWGNCPLRVKRILLNTVQPIVSKFPLDLTLLA